jgi:phage baseplate assembly protein W
MANILNRFFNEVVGSATKIRDYVSIITARGDFKRIEDLQVILTSWNTILLTPRRTYILDPDFGSDLYKYVFDPADDDTINNIKTEIVSRISLYDDRASIQEVAVKTLRGGKGYEIDIVADYKGLEGTLSLKVDDTTFANILTETSQ